MKMQNYNTMRTTLYDRLRPDVKARLEANQLDYEYTITKLIGTLMSKSFWDELTVRDISNLIVFSDSDMPSSASLMMHGDKSLIEPENEVI